LPLGALLERNLDEATALEWKRSLQHLLATGERIQRCLPRLQPGHGRELLLWFQALLIGLGHLSAPAAAVAGLLERVDLSPLRVDLSPLRVDLSPALATAATALVRGLCPSPAPAGRARKRERGRR
jgi:hypothetical protein